MRRALCTSLQTIRHFIDTGLGAGFVVLAARRAADADAAYGLFPDLDRQAAERGDDAAGRAKARRDRVVDQALRKGARRLPEHARGVGLALCELDCVVSRRVTPQRHQHVPAAIYNADTDRIAAAAALLDG